MSRVKKSSQIGAAAFALGLSLVGPQALGVAAADRGDGGSASVASRAQPSDTSARGVGREARAAHAARAAATRSSASDDGAGAVVRGPRAAAARSAAAAVRGPRAAAAARPVAVGAVSGSESSTITPGSGPVPVRMQAAAAGTETVSVTAAATAVSGARTGLRAGAAQPTASAQAIANVQGQKARPVLADRVGSIRAALNSGVNTVFDNLTNLLSSLPANPISDFLSGALSLVRRSLLDHVAPPETFTNVLRNNGQWAGSLNTVDPWDEVLTFTVTDAPDHGSVQINPDGTYTYTPDNDYIGTDSFTVNVNDPGFDLLDPLASRVQAVTATVDTSIATAGGSNFLYPSIKCTLDKSFKVKQVIYRIGQKGYEREVRNGPTVNPGNTWFASYADIKTGAPTAGSLFYYRVSLAKEDGDGISSKYDLFTIEFTQAEGSSTANVSVDRDPPAVGWQYSIVDVSDPNFSNSTKQVRVGAKSAPEA